MRVTHSNISGMRNVAVYETPSHSTARERRCEHVLIKHKKSQKRGHLGSFDWVLHAKTENDLHVTHRTSHFKRDRHWTLHFEKQDSYLTSLSLSMLIELPVYTNQHYQSQIMFH